MSAEAAAEPEIRCDYHAGPLGTAKNVCCPEEWTPYSIEFYRAWQQGQNRLFAGEPGPGYGDFQGWCCGRWLPHHDDIDRHLRTMHNLGGAR